MEKKEKQAAGNLPKVDPAVLTTSIHLSSDAHGCEKGHGSDQFIIHLRELFWELGFSCLGISYITSKSIRKSLGFGDFLWQES